MTPLRRKMLNDLLVRGLAGESGVNSNGESGVNSNNGESGVNSNNGESGVNSNIPP
jgi:hypothetical protein